MAEPAHDNEPESARKKLIELLDDIDAWRFTEPAFNQGRIALKPACGKTPSDCEMIDYIVARLRAGFPPHAYGRAARVAGDRLGDEQPRRQPNLH